MIFSCLINNLTFVSPIHILYFPVVLCLASPHPTCCFSSELEDEHQKGKKFSVTNLSVC